MTLNPADHQVGNSSPTQTAGNCDRPRLHVQHEPVAFSSPKRAYHSPNQAPNFSGSDWLGEDAAAKLAQKIKVFWAKQGKDVNVWTERFAARDNGYQAKGWFGIRSNMVGGRPK